MFQGHLRDHIRFKHEDIGYPCNQCDYKATQQVTYNVPPNSINKIFTYLMAHGYDLPKTTKNQLN